MAKEGKKITIRERLSDIVTDSKRLKKLQSRGIFSLFAVVSAFMSIINIITGRTTLLIATAAFAVLCSINLLLTFRGEKLAVIADYIFMVEITLLFTYFIITGGTDNFSTIWLLLLPSIGLFFFGMEMGSIMCLLVFLIMVCCFNIPALKLICTDYGDTFRMRFPFVYVACFLVSFLLEFIRDITQKSLNELRVKYMDLYSKDRLTGFKNRYGLDNTVDGLIPRNMNNVGVMIADIDHFKTVNDTYGHQNGDVILTEIARRIEAVLPENAYAFRWGGEEFVIICLDGSKCEKIAGDIWSSVRGRSFFLPDGTELKITISVGCTGGKLSSKSDMEELIKSADDRMYTAKVDGRDRVVSLSQPKNNEASPEEEAPVLQSPESSEKPDESATPTEPETVETNH